MADLVGAAHVVFLNGKILDNLLNPLLKNKSRISILDYFQLIFLERLIQKRKKFSEMGKEI